MTTLEIARSHRAAIRSMFSADRYANLMRELGHRIQMVAAKERKSFLHAAHEICAENYYPPSMVRCYLAAAAELIEPTQGE